MISKPTYTIKNGNEDCSFNSKDDIASFNSQHIYIKTNSKERFKLMYNALVAIGFPPRQIKNCYRVFACQNISDFIEMLIKSDEKYSHPFIKNNVGNSDLCEVCEEDQSKHYTAGTSRNPNEELLMQRNISHEEFEKKKTNTIKFLFILSA